MEKKRLKELKKERRMNVGKIVLFKSLTVLGVSFVLSPLALFNVSAASKVIDGSKVPATCKITMEDDFVENKTYLGKKEKPKEKNNITLYSKWEKLNDGTYERRVLKYNLKGKDIEQLKELLKDTNEDNLENVLDLVSKNVTETKMRKQDLSEEELNKNNFLLTYYVEDKEVTYELTTGDHVGNFVAANLVGAFVSLALYMTLENVFEKLSTSFEASRYEELTKIIKKEKKLTK